MTKIRNYFIIFASVFAISSACALVGVQDVKAQEGPALADLIKRIESLESRPGSNVTAGKGKIKGLNIGLHIRHRYEIRNQMIMDTAAFGLGGVTRGGGGNDGRTNRAATTLTGLTGTKPNTNLGRNETQDFTLQWVHMNFDFNVNRNVRAYVELQDARTFGVDSTTVGNRGSRTSAQEAYVELRNLENVSSVLKNVELRIGRWRAAYGNQRLIGALPWANQTRGYDGARLRWASDSKKHWVDAFAWQINEKETGVASGDSPSDDTDEVLYGIYSHFKVADGNVFEPYFLARARSAEDTQGAGVVVGAATGGAGSSGEQRYTLGFRLDGRNIGALPGLDYTVEPAWQFGTVEGFRTVGRLVDFDPATGTAAAGTSTGSNTNQSNRIQAFAIYAGTGYTFKNLPWTPRIGYAISYASGDKRADSGSAKTFDHLYPTGHGHNGYMDLTAWQNIVDHQIHLSFKPTKKLVVDAKLHLFDMDEEADHLYNVGGGIGYGGPGGVNRTGSDTYTDLNGEIRDVDDELGQELDITVKYKFLKNFGVTAGYSHFFAGDWIEDTGGGVDRGVDWAYLMTSVKF